jgi:hypothetical protein
MTKTLTQLAEDARKRTIKLMAVMQLMRKIKPMWGPCMVMLLFGLLAAHANPAGFFAGYVGARRMAAFVELENRIIWSQTFTDGSWVKSRGSIVAGAALAPDGTMTASKLVEDNSPATNHRIFSLGGSAIRLLPATVSFHAKAAERTQCFVRMTDYQGGTRGAYFDLLNGTVLSSEAGVTASIQDLGDGWYRCAVTRQSSGVDPNAYIAPAVNGSEFYNGDGTSGILIWGAQNNLGTTAKTYVATTDAIKE